MKEKLYKQAVKLGIENNILFTSYISNKQILRSAYAACELFVLPSEYGAFGLVLLNPMACEKPVIATNVGVSEIVDEKTGALVKYKDSNKLPCAIIDLLCNEGKRKEMGARDERKIALNLLEIKQSRR